VAIFKADPHLIRAFPERVHMLAHAERGNERAKKIKQYSGVTHLALLLNWPLEVVYPVQIEDYRVGSEAAQRQRSAAGTSAPRGEAKQARE
jgi:hypothetical protein